MIGDIFASDDSSSRHASLSKVVGIMQYHVSRAFECQQRLSTGHLSTQTHHPVASAAESSTNAVWKPDGNIVYVMDEHLGAYVGMECPSRKILSLHSIDLFDKLVVRVIFHH